MSEYIKQTWVDGETPVDAEHMNHLEEGVAAAHKAIAELPEIPEIPDVPAVDETLTVPGAAADAAAVGNAVTELTKEIVPLKDNLNNTVKSGTEIVYDCAEGQCICVEGDTEDEVTLVCSGKNLVPTLAKGGTQSGIIYTINDDGSIHVSGTATANVYLYLTPYGLNTYFPAGNYVFKSNIQLDNASPGGFVSVSSAAAQFTAFLLSKSRPIKRVQLAEGGYVTVYLYLSKNLTIDADIWCTAEREDVVDPSYVPDYTPCVTTIYNGQLPLQVVTHNGENTIYTTTNDRLVGTYYKIKTEQGNDDDVAVVTPEMYGAKRDGVTDDAPAILQAIGSGKSIVFSGDYTVKSPIAIPSSVRVDCDSLYRLLIYDDGEVVLNSDSLLSNATIRYYGDKSAVRIVGRKATVENCKIIGDGSGSGVFVGGENGIANAVIRECRIENFECAVKFESETWINACTVDVYTDDCKQSCVVKGDGHFLRIRGQSARLTVNNNELPQIVINGNYNRVEETLFDVGLVNNCVLGFAITGAFNIYDGTLAASRYARNSIAGSANQFARPSMTPGMQSQMLYTKSNWSDIVTAESVTVNSDLTTIDLDIAEHIKNRLLLNNHELPVYSTPGDTIGLAVFDISVQRLSRFVYAAFELGSMHYVGKIAIELIPESGEAIVLSNTNNNRLMYLLGGENERSLYQHNITTVRVIITLEGYAVDFIGASGLFA